MADETSINSVDKIPEYKCKIIEHLVNDKNVCQLILNRSISDLDSDIQDEVKKYINQYWFIPYAQEDEHTYINFDLAGTAEGQGITNNKLALGIYVFCHHRLMYCDFSDGITPLEFKKGTRIDHLNIALQRIFNGSFDFGVGKMKLNKDNPKQVNAVYYGRELGFSVSDIGNYSGAVDGM